MKPLRIWLVGTGTVGTWLAGAPGSVVFEADPVGRVTITGPGAGPQLAGLGVLSDIIAVASRRAEGA